MNDIMSLGLHRAWKKKMITYIKPKKSMKILDLATGTGDILKGILNMHSQYEPKLWGMDKSSLMIDEAKKNLPQNITWICGAAEKIELPSNHFDYCTLSFGLRNFEDTQKAITEIKRILVDNGVLLCMEFNNPKHAPFQAMYKQYLNQIIPELGNFFAHNREAYEYLGNSITNFPEKNEVMRWFNGFGAISCHSMAFGIVSLYIVKK